MLVRGLSYIFFGAVPLLGIRGDVLSRILFSQKRSAILRRDLRLNAQSFITVCGLFCLLTQSILAEIPERVMWPSMGFSFEVPPDWIRRDPRGLKEGLAEFLLGFADNRDGVAAHLIITISPKPEESLERVAKVRSDFYEFSNTPEQSQVDDVEALRFTRDTKTPPSSPHVMWVIWHQGIAYTVELFGASDFPDMEAADRVVNSILWTKPTSAFEAIRLEASLTKVDRGRCMIPLPHAARRSKHPGDHGDFFFVHDFPENREEVGFIIHSGVIPEPTQSVNAFAENYFAALRSTPELNYAAVMPVKIDDIQDTWVTGFLQTRMGKPSNPEEPSDNNRSIRYGLRVFDDRSFILVQTILNPFSVHGADHYLNLSDEMIRRAEIIDSPKR